MKIRILAAIFLGLTACGSADSNLQDEDTSDTGLPDWTSQGTQVGSEGIFGCEVDTTTPVEAQAVLEEFDKTPADLLAPLMGAWTGVFVDHQAQSLAFSMDFQPTVDFEWVTVLPTTGCQNYVQANTKATLSANPLLAEALEGRIGLRTDATKAIFSVSADQVVGTAKPLVLDSTAMNDTQLVLTADLSATTAVGEVRFVGCVGEICTDDDAQGAFDLSR